MEVLLCADALDDDMETGTVGGISRTTLDNFADRFSNTDVVFWLDACRDHIRRDKGENKPCKLQQFRTVRNTEPKISTSRVLWIFTCESGESAKDDGLTMSAVVDIMRERLEAKKKSCLVLRLRLLNALRRQITLFPFKTTGKSQVRIVPKAFRERLRIKITSKNPSKFDFFC